MPLALLALAIGAFGIGTTEFVIMGLLPEVAGDLRRHHPHCRISWSAAMRWAWCSALR